MSYILQQFFLHFFSGPFFIGIVFYALRYWMRRNPKVALWVPPDPRHLLVFSAALATLLISQREAYDLFLGRQTLAKTITDQISWFAMSAVGTWLIYRFACQERNR